MHAGEWNDILEPFEFSNDQTPMRCRCTVSIAHIKKSHTTIVSTPPPFQNTRLQFLPPLTSNLFNPCPNLIPSLVVSSQALPPYKPEQPRHIQRITTRSPQTLSNPQKERRKLTPRTSITNIKMIPPLLRRKLRAILRRDPVAEL
jgi:hypothetical protein